MGFIKILRWRVGALKRPRRRSRGVESDTLNRAAIFLIALGEEHAALLLERFEKYIGTALGTHAQSFGDPDPAEAFDVLEEFLSGISVDHLPSYVSRDELDDVARALVRANPDEVVQRVHQLWIGELTPISVPDDDNRILELDYEALEPGQKAAVFMMWLPPELSAMVLHKFPSNLVHVVTGILVELPFVGPEAREKVLAEFMEGVSLGIPGLAVDDLGLAVVVEAFVRSDPDGVAKRLEEKWLSGTLVGAAPKAKPSPTEGLTNWDKAAVFFSSLSLPLSWRLLNCMESSEVETLMQSIDALGGVDSGLRKAVLQELMRVSESGDTDSQPIHILSKAMSQMIRRKPEVVVGRLRKHWLGEQDEPQEG